MDVLSSLPSVASLGVTSWLLLLCVVFVAYWYLSAHRNLPPGPPSFPIIGSIPFIRGHELRGAMLKLARRYGNVMSLDMGNKTMVVLTGYETIREALVKHGAVFSYRPDDHMTQAYANKRGLTTAYGENQQTQRRFVLHVLRDFGLGKSTMDDVISDESSHLLEELENNMNTKYDTQLLLKKAASNIINLIAFGERRDYNDPMFIRAIELVMEIFKAMGGDNIKTMMPILRFFPGDLFGFQKFRSDIEELKAQYQEWIDRHKAQIEDGNEPTDLIGRYLVQINKDPSSTDFTEEQLLHIIGDLFLAATDTSSSTMYWILLYLVLNPHIQDKVHSEIQDVIGSDRAPRVQDRPHLHYTEAVIAEVMRVANVAPFTLPHACSEDIIFQGHYIPKGMMVMILTHSVDMDPSIWTEPEKFDPERFLDRDGKFQKREEQILFSMGKRSCIGEGLARKEIFLFLTNIVQKFRITLPEDEPTPSTHGIRGAIFNPAPYNIIITKRDSS